VAWWQVVFWALIVPALIVMGIIYGTQKKLFKLFYVLTTFTYITTIAYVIDVYALGRNWILGLLVFSAFLLLMLGFWLTKHPEHERAKKRTKKTRTNLVILLVILLVMVLLLVVSFLRLGYTRQVNMVSGVLRTDLLHIETQGRAYTERFIPVGNLTYTNAFFIPAVIPDYLFTACWYSTKTQEILPQDLTVQLNNQYAGSGYLSTDNQLPEVRGTPVVNKVTVSQQFFPVAKVDPTQAVPTAMDYNVTKEDLAKFDPYDAILVVASSDYVQCGNVKDLRSKGRISFEATVPVIG
jgi:hypothetical protein